MGTDSPLDGDDDGRVSATELQDGLDGNVFVMCSHHNTDSKR